MSAPDRQLSRAIVVYLGKGWDAWPQRSDDRVRVAFPDGAEPLVERVRAVVHEVLALEVSVHGTLPQAGEHVRRRVERDHPELDETAVVALVWA